MSTKVTKSKVCKVNVNLQQGFLADETYNTMFAAFNHHRKEIIWKEGFRREYFNIPKELETYNDVSNDVAGHFNIGYWSMKEGGNKEY